jgi:hypothetical protein
MIRYWLLGALLLLAGCASQAPLPAAQVRLALPLQLHVQRQQQQQSQDWLLVIQQEGAALRWSLLDLLGIPQARQRLVEGAWQADGLLPPNPEARELFAAVLFALTPAEQLAGSYPAARQVGQQRQLGERWAVEYGQPDTFTLRLGQGLQYRVSPLPNETAP